MTPTKPGPGYLAAVALLQSRGVPRDAQGRWDVSKQIKDHK